MTNLPANMIREIASRTSPKTRRAMARATTIPRRQTPIGLAVTKVGLPVIPKIRPSPMNRSRAVAKTPIVRYSSDPIDGANPAAYKNNTWKYYLYLTKHHIVFANAVQVPGRGGRLRTRAGQPYLINTRTGARTPLPARLQNRFDNRLGEMKVRRPTYHTWNAYQKRLMRDSKLRAGQPGYDAMIMNVDKKVQRFLNGTKHALNNVPFSRLILWSRTKNWINSNGVPYVKQKNGKWYPYGSNIPLTKNRLMNNIKFFHSLRN